MAKAPKTQKTYEVLAENLYPARLYEIVHIGTVKNFMGEERNTLRLTFELPTVLRRFKENEDMKPMTVGQDYTFSMFNKANLRKVVESLLGKSLTDSEADELDIVDVLGKVCLLNIKNKDKKDGSGKYHYIDSAIKLMDGMIEKPPVNPWLSYWVENPDASVFEKLPKFIQEKIVTSKEYRIAQGNYTPDTTEDSSLEHSLGDDGFNGL